MKKTILIFSFLLICGLSAFSQVTKADIESMLSEEGLTLATLKSVEVDNYLHTYTDGSYGR